MEVQEALGWILEGQQPPKAHHLSWDSSLVSHWGLFAQPLVQSLLWQLASLGSRLSTCGQSGRVTGVPCRGCIPVACVVLLKQGTSWLVRVPSEGLAWAR